MTAIQWNEEYMRICANEAAVHGQLLPSPQNIAFIQRVMDDAAGHARREALMVATKAYRPLKSDREKHLTALQRIAKNIGSDHAATIAKEAIEGTK